MDTPGATAVGTIRCRVAARAVVHASAEALDQLRRQPPPLAGHPLPASLLKHSDAQTLAAIAAVYQAIAAQSWQGKSFADWGVVAAPSFFGRFATADAIQRYTEEGVWGISPHTIPHRSLHAVSGTISQLLKIHGPNFGVDSGPRGSGDGLLVAATLLADGSVPGLWFVATGYRHEYVPADNTMPVAAPPVCDAVALALVAPGDEADGPYLDIAPEAAPGALAALSLANFVEGNPC